MLDSEHTTQLSGDNPSQKCKLLIASDGNRSYVLLNGHFISSASSIQYTHNGGESAKLSIGGVSLSSLGKGDASFFDHVEEMLGYKIRNA